MKRAQGLLIAAVLGLMAVSAWLSNTVWFRQDIHNDTRLTRTLPTEIGKWRMVEEFSPSAQEFRGLETRDVIKRTYSDGKNLIELVVAYIAHSSRKSAHAQEACLRGSGALVGNIYQKQLKDSPVELTVISLESQTHKSQVYYWYKIGTRYTSDYFRSSFLMFLGGLTGKKSQGASLIRLLSPAKSGEPPEAVHSRMDDFAKSLIPSLEAVLP